MTLGGSEDAPPALGKVVGRSFRAGEIPAVIDKVVTVYRKQRSGGEKFIDTLRRIGLEPFRDDLYGGLNVDSD